MYCLVTGRLLGSQVLKKMVQVGLLVYRYVSRPSAPVTSNFDQGSYRYVIDLYGYWATDITGTVVYGSLDQYS